MTPITLNLELKGGFKFKKFIAGAYGTLAFSTAGAAPVNCYKQKMYIPIAGKGSCVSFFFFTEGAQFPGWIYRTSVSFQP